MSIEIQKIKEEKCAEFAADTYVRPRVRYMRERARRGGKCTECGELLCEYDEVRYSGGKPYCFACYIEVERYERGDYEGEDEC